VTERRGDDSTGVARAVEEIEGASILFAVVLVLGPAWSMLVAFAGWGLLTWVLGMAVWCFLLFRAVQNVQSLRCPRCGRPWRPRLTEVGRRVWPTQRRCSVCGFGLDDCSAVLSATTPWTRVGRRGAGDDTTTRIGLWHS